MKKRATELLLDLCSNKVPPHIALLNRTLFAAASTSINCIDFLPKSASLATDLSAFYQNLSAVKDIWFSLFDDIGLSLLSHIS